MNGKFDLRTDLNKNDLMHFAILRVLDFPSGGDRGDAIYRTRVHRVLGISRPAGDIPPVLYREQEYTTDLVSNQGHQGQLLVNFFY